MWYSVVCELDHGVKRVSVFPCTEIEIRSVWQRPQRILLDHRAWTPSTFHNESFPYAALWLYIREARNAKRVPFRSSRIFSQQCNFTPRKYAAPLRAAALINLVQGERTRPKADVKLDSQDWLKEPLLWWKNKLRCGERVLLVLFTWSCCSCLHWPFYTVWKYTQKTSWQKLSRWKQTFDSPDAFEAPLLLQLIMEIMNSAPY